MLRFCKLGQLRGLLGATILLLASSTSQAMDQENSASRLFRETVGTIIAIPSLVIEKTYLYIVHGNTGWHREKFFEIVESLGYELKKADTTIGLIPEIKLVYEQNRELNDIDREIIEKEISEFEEKDPTWIEGILEARILRMLLHASEGREFRISEFDIYVLPIPGFGFSTSPVDISYTVDTQLVLRRMYEIQNSKVHN